MTDHSRPRLFLIDGSAQIFRAYHAIRTGLSTSSGMPTNAVYGYTQMLLKVVRDHTPDFLAVVFDLPQPTFRHEIFPEYKANRPPPPEDLIPQFDLVKKVTAAFNIPVLEKAGLEADDIIGTLAHQAEECGMETVVVTGDKDFFQIVSEHVTLLDTMKDRTTGIAEVKEKYGIGPDQVIEVMGLMGDTADNVPGIPGVGEKTAVKLIGQYDTIENVLEHAGEIKGKLGEKVRANAEGARLSRKLVTIVTDADLGLDPKSFGYTEPDTKALEEVFAELEFHTLLETFAAPKKVKEAEYICVSTTDALTAMVAEMRAAGRFAVDTETTSLSPTEAELVGLSFSCEEGKAYYIPVAHEGEQVAQIPKDKAIEILKPLLEDPQIAKIGQNIKYDWIVLSGAGINLQGAVDDTMVASYLLNPSRNSHGMDALASEFLNRRTISFKEVAGTGKNQILFSQVPLEEATSYAAEDAEVTWCLAEKLLPQVKKENLQELYEDLEMPLVEVLACMEQTGVCLDLPFFEKLSGETLVEIDKLTESIHELAGSEFNLNSPKQLAVILFEEMKIPPVKKTKTGYSTNVEVLEKLAPDYEICRQILDYRQAQKLKSTYIDALPRLINPATKRIHTSFNQTVTATGRLSSSDPNLQNIPIRTEAGRRIRTGFIAPEGSVLVGADYSQIELRILAHVSEDPDLIDSFQKGDDIHTRTAQQMFGLLPGMVTSDMRRQAKTINFGIIYGMSAFGLARQLGISRTEAQRLIDAYFTQYVGVKRFIDDTIRQARKDKQVETLFGRRRLVPDIGAKNRNVREFAERIAVNTPIQGTAADIIKKAMIAIHQRLKREKMETRMILQIHDELLLEAPLAEEEKAKALLTEEMENAASLKVPLVVDMASGSNWSQVH